VAYQCGAPKWPYAINVTRLTTRATRPARTIARHAFCGSATLRTYCIRKTPCLMPD